VQTPIPLDPKTVNLERADPSEMLTQLAERSHEETHRNNG
jgi:hypothetical protein